MDWKDWCARIIPARAGFTGLILCVVLNLSDHPRSRGVYRSRDSVCSALAGSSPLARGLQERRLRPRSTARIIPARAGFTSSYGKPTRTHPDHPRSRGVYHHSARTGLGRSGSSPLARGLRGVRPPLDSESGIIPARAGFTPLSGTRVGGAGDHPRSRGVYANGSLTASPVGGSSPLARGLRRVPRR